MKYIDRYRQLLAQHAYERAWARKEWDTVLAPYSRTK